MTLRMLILAVASIGAATGASLAEGGQIRAGKATLAQACAECHAISASGDSPNQEAPPFREVVRRYPAGDLEESLAEGIMTGHPDMPEVQFTPEQIAGVIAYLDALAVVSGEDPR
jgi:cytochrome c